MWVADLGEAERVGVTKTKETGVGPGQGIRGVVEDKALGKLGGRGQEEEETDWMG